MSNKINTIILLYNSKYKIIESVTLSEVSQTEEKYHMDIPYMWNPKRNDTSELIKQKEAHRLRKRTHGCQQKG